MAILDMDVPRALALQSGGVVANPLLVCLVPSSPEALEPLIRAGCTGLKEAETSARVQAARVELEKYQVRLGLN